MMKRFFQSKISSSFKSAEFWIVLIIILLATYMLTPRFWEPAGESWKQWAAARILRQTGGFPVWTLGPAYVVYLQLFNLLHYPYSVQLEHFVTHLFAYLAIYLMLRSILPVFFALLLTCAWIPRLAVIEPGGAVAGIGLLAMYFRESMLSKSKKGYLSVWLLTATLCHSAFLLFLAGNAIGVFIDRRLKKQPLFNFSLRQTHISSAAIKVALLILVLLVIIFPSQRWDYNHWLADGTYAPVSLKNPLTVNFFQVGNWKYVNRNVPEADWLNQDWYFVNKVAFGGAKTVLEAVLKRPATVMKNTFDNFMPAFSVPMDFILGDPRPALAAFFFVLFLIGFWGMFRRMWRDGLIVLIVAIITGSAALFLILLFTWYNPRYYMMLLPVAFLLLAHFGFGFQYLAKYLLAAANSSKLLISSCLLILLGVVLNERTGDILLHKALSVSTRWQVRSLDILLIVSGILLAVFIIYQPRFLVRAVKGCAQRNPLFITFISIFISSASVLLTAWYPQGKTVQIGAVLRNQALLSASLPVSMVTAYPKIFAAIDNQTHILALEDTWIKAFSKEADLDKIYNVFSLPPFPDTSGRVEKWLNNLDLILVSDAWSSAKNSTLLTQVFLRYRLHVAPFLEKALTKGWIVENISGYGKKYRKN